MKPSKAWSGALELAVGDLTVNANVSLYRRRQKARTESFKTIDEQGRLLPTHAGKTTYFDVDGNETKTFKGIHASGPKTGLKARYVAVDEETQEKMTEGSKTRIAKPVQFVKLDDVDLTLAIDSYAVRPDADVPGADQAVKILWNGLRAHRGAYVAQVALTGQMDSVMVVYATETDLLAALLPFENELYEVPPLEFEPDAKAAQVAGQAIEQSYGITDFELDSFESEYKARRQKVVDQVLAGADIEVEPEPEPVETPNLLAQLEQSLAQVAS
jgi:non-homologous end joining protein Ku